jgi:hypothetical protein
MGQTIGVPGEPHPSDSFTVTMRSVWGDTWEWPAVGREEAQAVHRHLVDGPVVFTGAEQ